MQTEYTPAAATPPKTILLADYAPPDFLARHIDLIVRLFDDRAEVVSTTAYHRNGDHTRPLVLQGIKDHLKTVQINGASAPHDIAPDGTLTVPTSADALTLTITTQFDPRANTELEGLYWSKGTYCTQCEPEGFRRITFAPDRPDVMATYDVRIEGDKATLPVLLSNGNLVKEGDLPDGRHFAHWHDPFPKPSYLFALVAGDLIHIQDSFTTQSGRAVDLRIYVRAGDEGQCAHAMTSLKKAMAWDETVYGREYDLDRFNIVAVSDFNMGAMENKSLNIFNSAYVLAHPNTATDADFMNVESVIAHEYFHNWTGNRITCRDWFQLSLKEGLTVFRDQEFSADMNSRAVQRIDDVTTLRRMQFAEDASPLAHPVRPESYIEINNFYTMTVYEKGAEVIRMFHTLLGADKFRQATDLYFQRFDGMAVTCDDFARCMADVACFDTSQFKLWYTQAGTPQVTARGDYDAAARRYTLTLSQYVPETPGQPDKKPMHIPVRVALFNPNGDEIDLGGGAREKVLHLREDQQHFVFDNVTERPVPSLLRGFSAPVRLTMDLGTDDLKFLMIHDTDGFNRWDAAQTLILREINHLIDARERGQDAALSDTIRQAFTELVAQAEDDGSDRALLARMLTLPDIATIGQSRTIVDPDAIHVVRTQVLRALGLSAQPILARLYDALRARSTPDLTQTSMADRAFMSVLLRLWAEAETQGQDAAAKLYYAAQTMTDRVTALSVLSGTQHAFRNVLFADFYERFKDHELVINKWFSLQASAVRGSIHQDVAALIRHPDFTLSNPNRARAVYGAFGMSNPVAFHDRDGRGYRFVMDAIIQMDETNPSVAARLLTLFREWKSYAPERQALMRAEIDRLLKRPNLSRAVYEIASKSIA